MDPAASSGVTVSRRRGAAGADVAGAADGHRLAALEDGDSAKTRAAAGHGRGRGGGWRRTSGHAPTALARRSEHSSAPARTRPSEVVARAVDAAASGPAGSGASLALLCRERTCWIRWAGSASPGRLVGCTVSGSDPRGSPRRTALRAAVLPGRRSAIRAAAEVGVCSPGPAAAQCGAEAPPRGGGFPTAPGGAGGHGSAPSPTGAPGPPLPHPEGDRPSSAMRADRDPARAAPLP